MKYIASLFVERRSDAPSALWGDDVAEGIHRDLQRLAVLVWTRDDTEDSVLCYGVDPDHTDPLVDQPVFAKVVPVPKLGAFLKIVLDGEQSTLGGGALADSVDISNAQPPPAGPRIHVVFGYAQSLPTDETSDLAEPPDPTDPVTPASW